MSAVRSHGRHAARKESQTIGIGMPNRMPGARAVGWVRPRAGMRSVRIMRAALARIIQCAAIRHRGPPEHGATR